MPSSIARQAISRNLIIEIIRLILTILLNLYLLEVSQSVPTPVSVRTPHRVLPHRRERATDSETEEPLNGLDEVDEAIDSDGPHV